LTREEFELAVSDATIKQSWKPPFRKLQAALDTLQTVAGSSPTKIMAAIPDEHFAATVERVEWAKNFSTTLAAKMRQRLEC